MAEWTDELKAEVIAAYKAANPTGETSTEIIKDLADKFDQSPNGVRMILVKDGCYVKKDTPSSGTKTTAKTADGKEPAKRVSKEASIGALVSALKNAGAEVDMEILEKLTGKAAVYLAGVITSLKS